MSTQMKSTILLAFIAFVMSATNSSLAQEHKYRYAWIDLPGLTNERQGVLVGGINEAGVVTGAAATSSYIYDDAAVVWDAQGRITVLESLGGSRSSAHDITDLSGFTIGKAIYQGGDPLKPRGVYWRNGVITDIGTFGGETTNVADVNNLEQIVGESKNELDRNEAFIWENGELRRLPVLDLPVGGAMGINEHGDIVGGVVVDDNGHSITIPVLWVGGDKIIALPDLGGDSPVPATPWAINDQRIVVGTAYTPNDQWHAVVWVNKKICDIHERRLGSSSRAMDINNNNVIVGTLGSFFSSDAFVWEQKTGMQLLDELVPPLLRKPWRIQPSLRINDAGQIAAQAMLKGSNDEWVVLLSPVYPTIEISGPTPGIAGEMNTFEVTDAKPGAEVVFTYSNHGGGFRIPGCDLQQNALQLENPKIVGSAIADANGNASIQRFVPKGAAGKIILFQAVVVNDCAISQLVGHQFE